MAEMSHHVQQKEHASKAIDLEIHEIGQQCAPRERLGN